MGNCNLSVMLGRWEEKQERLTGGRKPAKHWLAFLYAFIWTCKKSRQLRERGTDRQDKIACYQKGDLPRFTNCSLSH